jgi:hypothetical protein
MESAISDIEYFIRQYKNSQFDHDKRKYWLCLYGAIKELDPTSIFGTACDNAQPHFNEHLFRT